MLHKLYRTENYVNIPIWKNVYFFYPCSDFTIIGHVGRDVSTEQVWLAGTISFGPNSNYFPCCQSEKSP